MTYTGQTRPTLGPGLCNICRAAVWYVRTSTTACWRDADGRMHTCKETR